MLSSFTFRIHFHHCTFWTRTLTHIREIILEGSSEHVHLISSSSSHCAQRSVEGFPPCLRALKSWPADSLSCPEQAQNNIIINILLINIIYIYIGWTNTQWKCVLWSDSLAFWVLFVGEGERMSNVPDQNKQDQSDGFQHWVQKPADVRIKDKTKVKVRYSYSFFSPLNTLLLDLMYKTYLITINEMIMKLKGSKNVLSLFLSRLPTPTLDSTSKS